jgi:hypothetical protein
MAKSLHEQCSEAERLAAAALAGMTEPAFCFVLRELPAFSGPFTLGQVARAALTHQLVTLARLSEEPGNPDPNPGSVVWLQALDAGQSMDDFTADIMVFATEAEAKASAQRNHDNLFPAKPLEWVCTSEGYFKAKASEGENWLFVYAAQVGGR